MDKNDILIAQLMEENKLLRERIRVLEEKIARLEKDSNNSSKPPSGDIFIYILQKIKGKIYIKIRTLN